MKIKVRSKEDNFHLKIWIPTSCIRWKWIWNVAEKHDKSSGVDYEVFKAISPKLFKELQRYIQENGHFTLVDVISSDGDIIKITI
ncbi:MAG: hypothetical protein H6687_01340 [Bacillales bacterium]|nr:hypothetical protein [Bacillales bacterium]